MRSILEKALIALLNEEKDKADVLFHDFILERSRQIHESLRQGEDFILDESMENELAIDEMFGDDDLAEDDEEDMVADAGDELAAGDEVSDVAGDDDADLALDGDEGEPATIDDRVSDLEADLQALAAEFDAMMSGEEVETGDDLEGDTDEDTSADADVDAVEGDDELEEGVVEITAHANGEIDITATTDDEGDDLGLPAMGGLDDLTAMDDLGDDELDASDFDDLSESAFDNYTDVSVASGDGREQGDKKFTQNSTSVLKNHGVNDRAFKGSPVKIKSTEVKGYPEPAAIPSKKLDARQNIKAKATDGQSSVSKEGDKAALLNKLGADAKAQSIIGSKK